MKKALERDANTACWL